MVTLSINKLQKSYDYLTVLDNISFSVNKGEFVSILGASGCGKTTLLRIIAGLDISDSGSIFIDGKDITDVPPSKRNIGMVFQSYSLFPNMTVYQNITYALNYRKNKNRNGLQSDMVNEVIKKCELENVLDKHPCQLSGGQQQRTAIARSLVMSPDILLFDEPFSALDAYLRLNLRKLIKQFQKDYHISILYVTHDQEEAFTLSNKIVVLNDGVIQQIGTPDEIYRYPKNSFVADFTHRQLKERYTNLCSIIQPARISINSN